MGNPNRTGKAVISFKTQGGGKPVEKFGQGFVGNGHFLRSGAECIRRAINHDRRFPYCVDKSLLSAVLVVHSQNTAQGNPKIKGFFAGLALPLVRLIKVNQRTARPVAACTV